MIPCATCPCLLVYAVFFWMQYQSACPASGICRLRDQPLLSLRFQSVNTGPSEAVDSQ